MNAQNVASPPGDDNTSEIRRVAQKWGMQAHRAFFADLDVLYQHAYRAGFHDGRLTPASAPGTAVGYTGATEGRKEGGKEASTATEGTRTSIRSCFLPSLPLTAQAGSKNGILEESLHEVGLRSPIHIATAAANLSVFADSKVALGAVIAHAQRHANQRPIAGLVATICRDPNQLRSIVGDALEHKTAEELRTRLTDLLANFRMPR